ncbi:MAG: hypothetical protein F4Y42_02380 [Caldilineaceae bacterium SB0664_bin_27]|uniref:Glycosyltransferase RgtA/B/C/D-like domain-containing protein n=1 Tax=Caldilineaceae bacterium SB0664_bin_27 TaxID=2605260 RepID=A0A6B0YQ03_9CHLR|nr:hypothetical protein [Caldilineaceae bacterium SB0664_bin_27]
MPDRISAGQSSHNLTKYQRNDWKFVPLVALAIAIALTVVVVQMRLYRLSDVPYGIINDEGANGVDALQVLQGRHNVFFAEKASGREALAIYATALATHFLGPSLLAFHLPPALASAGAVFAVFWLGLLLFGRDEQSGKPRPWRGLTVAGIGAGLMAASIGQTFLARGGFRANFLPLILTLSLALLWRSWGHSGNRKASWWGLALAGASAGLLLYTYIPARMAPFLYLLFGLSFLIPFGSVAKERVVTEWPKAGVFAAAAGLVAAPILAYFILHPEDFFFRSREISLSLDSHRTQLGAFLNNVVDYLLIFGAVGDRNEEYNFAGKPLLSLWEALFFWAGVGLSLWGWRRRPAFRLLLIWLVVMLLPAMLAYNRGNGPNSLRIIGAAPAVYLLVGVGIWETFRLLKGRISFNSATAAAAVGLLVTGFILVQGMFAYRTYFHEWVGTPQYYAAADAEMAEAAQVLNEQSSDAESVYLIPYHLSNGHYGFDYLYQGEAPAHVIHSTMTHLPQTIESILASNEVVSSVKVVDWNDELGWIGGGEEYTVALLEKYGTYLGSKQHTYFQVHTFSDIALDNSWTFYESLGPPSVDYDGGISLLGIALGQGNTQLSTQQQINLGPERTFWIAKKWQTAPGLGTEFAVSLRLHDSEGGGVYQRDIVLLNPNHSRTNNWSPEQPVETLYHMEIPPDLKPGEYELRLVVYDYETLQPTVELGVWKPEAVLGFLQVE